MEAAATCKKFAQNLIFFVLESYIASFVDLSLQKLNGNFVVFLSQSVTGLQLVGLYCVINFMYSQTQLNKLEIFYFKIISVSSLK